ncbi:hypothetical protein [Pelagicoccus mobilis]|uniref:Copper resistance protein B n=1 Tax=Pelagicoccus mobilis TaxID=415221 RepID=A0A934S6P5_9BACT|nr:hypothetical protein [Pelagicoccus mobilis]MBK1880374.1 hypothetical protein [Pelagicoccus mobilis]
MKLNSHFAKLCLFSVSSIAPLVHAGISFEAKAASEAFYRGIQEADVNWQSSLELGFGDFYLGAWGLSPEEGRSAPDLFNERYEIYTGYGWALADLVGLDVGAIRGLDPHDDEFTEAYVGLYAEFGTIAPSIYIYNDIDTDQWTAEAEATLSVPLNLFPIDTTARLGLIDGDVDYSYFEVDLVYPIRLGDLAKLSLGLHYTDNDFGIGVPDNSLYGSASVRLNF